MDECQLYSTLLGLKTPWKVEKVDVDSTNKTVEINVIHERNQSLPVISAGRSAWYTVTSKRGCGAISTAWISSHDRGTPSVAREDEQVPYDV